MTEKLELFDKANSIIAIRQRQRDPHDVRALIERLRERLTEGEDSSYYSRILKQACDDLLDLPSPNTAPRFALKDYVIEEIKRLSENDLPRYLFYRYRYDILPQQHRHDDFPPCLQVEPTSICNYRCVFCYQTDKDCTAPKNKHMGIMSLDLFKRVVDQTETACEAVTLASRGEPLMNPRIKEMLAYVSGKFLALKINTNAWFVDEAMSHAILEAGANTLVFSADAASEPLYSQLRVNGNLDRVLRNIDLFQEIRARHYTSSRLITRVSGVRYSADQSMDQMENVWGTRVDQVAFVDYNPWENTYLRPVNEVAAPCSDLWRRMFVWWNGVVNPCDVDYKSTLAAGDVNTTSLSAIWTGAKYAALRSAHLSARRATVTPCNRCTVV